MLSERNEANGGTKETLFSHSEDQTCDSSATHLQHLRQRLSHAQTGWRPAKALRSSSDMMGVGSASRPAPCAGEAATRLRSSSGGSISGCWNLPRASAWHSINIFIIIYPSYNPSFHHQSRDSADEYTALSLFALMFLSQRSIYCHHASSLPR